MPKIDKEKELILESLRFELQLLNSGIYNPSVKTPQTHPVPFIDSVTCINYQDPTKSIPCKEGCVLMHFVPEDKQRLDTPCHHIPLNERGDTVAKLVQTNDPEAAIEIIKTWLESIIMKLEQELSTTE